MFRSRQGGGGDPIIILRRSHNHHHDPRIIETNATAGIIKKYCFRNGAVRV